MVFHCATLDSQLFTEWRSEICMALICLSAPARAGLWVCPNQAVCQSTDHKGWVLTVDKMSPKVSLTVCPISCSISMNIHWKEGWLPLRWEYSPGPCSVLFSLLCSVLIKIIQTFKASGWCLQLLSLGNSALPIRPTAAALQSLLRGWGHLGSSSLLIHVPLWPSIPWSMTRLIWPACSGLAGTLEAKLTWENSPKKQTNWYHMDGQLMH